LMPKSEMKIERMKNNDFFSFLFLSASFIKPSNNHYKATLSNSDLTAQSDFV
jgi:hypothetical protein